MADFQLELSGLATGTGSGVEGGSRERGPLPVRQDHAPTFPVVQKFRAGIFRKWNRRSCHDKPCDARPRLKALAS
jgi:hypothetical protein